MDPEKNLDQFTPQTPKRTPKTPTTPRVKSPSTNRSSPYTSSSSPSQQLKLLSRNSSNAGTPTLSIARDEPNSTTPAYPESSFLANRAASNKIQLSDTEPLDPETMERIKNLEISIQHHQKSEESLLNKISLLKQEYVTSKEHHDQLIHTGNLKLQSIDRKMAKLQSESLNSSAEQQELWKKVDELDSRLKEVENEVSEQKRNFIELKEHKESILRERDETEIVAIANSKKNIKNNQIEYDQMVGILTEARNVEENLEESFGDGKVSELRAKVKEKNERIFQLQAARDESKSSMMVEEKIADELVNLFEMIYTRRIRSQEEELQGSLHKAKEEESKRAIEVMTAAKEDEQLRPLLKEMEDKASREEYDLMIDQEELRELELELESLKLKLFQQNS
ncbi:hypothetical protein BGZ76_006756 [Entomortierella beljakovae]|nr:hypothetical protein BGZ76_006756 [Entomortierella beljakovae]